MNTTTAIINVLQAMGADPIATTNATGETVVKVNAPIIKREDRKQ